MQRINFYLLMNYNSVPKTGVHCRTPVLAGLKLIPEFDFSNYRTINQIIRNGPKMTLKRLKIAVSAVPRSSFVPGLFHQTFHPKYLYTSVLCVCVCVVEQRERERDT